MCLIEVNIFLSDSGFAERQPFQFQENETKTSNFYAVGIAWYHDLLPRL